MNASPPARWRAAGRTLAAAGFAIVLLLTLLPHGGAPQEPEACLLCGDRGLSDAILNVALFLPLGFGLAAAGVRPLRVFLLGLLLTAAVETAQIWIPGRDPSLGDVLCNSLGALAGGWLGTRRSSWMAPTRGAARWLCLAAGALAAGIVVATGLLLRPSVGRAELYGQWTPELGNFGLYRGRVLSAAVGGRPAPSARLEPTGLFTELFRRAAPVEVRFLAGPPPDRLSPIFSVFDRNEREVFLLGADGEDLVVRRRRLADRLRLDRPELRVRGALAGLLPGDTLDAVVRGQGAATCVSLSPVEVRECPMRYPPGRGWALLLFPEELSRPWLLGLDALWAGLLALPLGLWLRRDAVAWLGPSLLAAGLWVGAPVTGLLPAGLPEALGAVGGLLGGRALRSLAAWLDRAPSWRP